MNKALRFIAPCITFLWSDIGPSLSFTNKINLRLNYIQKNKRTACCIEYPSQKKNVNFYFYYTNKIRQITWNAHAIYIHSEFIFLIFVSLKKGQNSSTEFFFLLFIFALFYCCCCWWCFSDRQTHHTEMIELREKLFSFRIQS